MTKVYQIALPLVDGRGAGLGNEMIVWAKAFIAGQMLGLAVAHPAWGLNRRGYRRYFGTSPVDWAWHRALQKGLPFFRFDDAERVRLGGVFEPALAAFAAEHMLSRRGPFVLGLHGLGGGYAQLAPARDFLRAQLLGTRGTLANLFGMNARLGNERLRVGLHVRRGDFGGLAAHETYRGRFNVVIPLDWYIRVARQLAHTLGEKATFVVVSDATEDELRPLTRAVRCELTSHQTHRDVSDLLILASCDFLVCSISSYSLWATFLSEARYGWFAPNLTPEYGFGSIWGHEAEQQAPGASTRVALDRAVTLEEPFATRGVAIGEEGRVPDELMADLAHRAGLKRREFDLLRYGVTPMPD